MAPSSEGGGKVSSEREMPKLPPTPSGIMTFTAEADAFEQWASKAEKILLQKEAEVAQARDAIQAQLQSQLEKARADADAVLREKEGQMAQQRNAIQTRLREQIEKARAEAEHETTTLQLKHDAAAQEIVESRDMAVSKLQSSSDYMLRSATRGHDEWNRSTRKQIQDARMRAEELRGAMRQHQGPRQAPDPVPARERPTEHYCPISHEVMQDPVIALDGKTYEREAIAEWFKHHNTSPITRAVVPSTLIPNDALRNIIEDWVA